MRLFAFRFFTLILSILSCAAAASATGAPVLALLTEARVAGESIHLSDLMPARTPSAILDAGGKISLGNAPPPGGSITLSGEKIASFLSPETRQEISIPPQVLVHRSGRLLTRDEVVAALRLALQSNKLPGASRLEPEDVNFSASVLVSVANARLEVRRIDFDPALKQARFLLASAADPRSLPFLVTADVRSDSPNSSSNTAETLAASLGGDYHRAHSADISFGEVPLVEPRKIAKLHVSSGTMQMFLAVLPLEKGSLHESVRVKVIGSGRILVGQVTAPGRLEAQF